MPPSPDLRGRQQANAPAGGLQAARRYRASIRTTWGATSSKISAGDLAGDGAGLTTTSNAVVARACWRMSAAVAALINARLRANRPERAAERARLLDSNGRCASVSTASAGSSRRATPPPRSGSGWRRPSGMRRGWRGVGAPQGPDQAGTPPGSPCQGRGLPPGPPSRAQERRRPGAGATTAGCRADRGSPGPP